MLVEVGTAPQKHIEEILRLLNTVFQLMTEESLKILTIHAIFMSV